MKKRKVVLAVTNDLFTDQRIHRISCTLTKENFDVLIIGRLLKNSSKHEPSQYQTKRFRMLFTKGPQFYLFYNIRLVLYLLFQKIDIMVSNDLDTLFGSYTLAKLKRIPLVYDSHELFTELPELQDHKAKQKIWKKLEALIVPKIKYTYTVCDSLASIYNNLYKTNFKTIRNLPFKKGTVPLAKIHKLFRDKKIILYQGSVNIGRGLEKTIKAMQYINDVVFIIIGRGDIEMKLQNLVRSEGLEDKVHFTGVIPYEELHSYTCMANLGISLEDNLGDNYYYALPNKLFDYIQASVPVLTSTFPEMTNIVVKYNIGLTTNENDPKELANIIKYMLNDQDKIDMWQKELKKSSQILNWEVEEKKIIELYNSIP